MEPLAELVELAVLIAISLILIVGVVFRPTTADITRRRLAVSVREETARDVLGSAPTREASQIFRKLVRDAHQLGLTIDWEQARAETTTTRPGLTLLATARRQISHAR